MNQNEIDTLPPPPGPDPTGIDSQRDRLVAYHRDYLDEHRTGLEAALGREVSPAREVRVMGWLSDATQHAFEHGAQPETDLRTAVALLTDGMRAMRLALAALEERVEHLETREASLERELVKKNAEVTDLRKRLGMKEG